MSQPPTTLRELTESLPPPPPTPKWVGRLESLTAPIIPLFGVAMFAVLVASLFVIEWIAETLYPITLAVSEIGLFLVTPVCLVLAIFKKSRGVAASGVMLVSYALGFNLWLYGFLIALTLAGVGWVIVGLFMAGVGVVGVAFVASCIRGAWVVTRDITLICVTCFGLRAFAFFLASKSE